MGNAESLPEGNAADRGFPGSTLLDNIQCGSLEDTEESPVKGKTIGISKFLNQAETLCTQSPNSEAGFGDSEFDDEYEEFRKDGVEGEDEDDENDDDDDGIVAGQRGNGYSTPTPTSPANPTSALFARALVNEVTDNPKTMRPAAMAEREKKLLKAQDKARKPKVPGEDGSRPVGAPGGIGQPSVLGSIAHALTGTHDPLGTGTKQTEKASVLPPNSISENRAQVDSNIPPATMGKYTITIGLSLSRRSSLGHTDTVTRQTAFDFNELQDRQYKYVSSTDSSGWRAGGGERGGPQGAMDMEEEDDFAGTPLQHMGKPGTPGTPSGGGQNHKVAAPDTVHIPIIHIDAESPQAVDAIIAALARGEVFIPHMAILPESLSVDGVSPPDLVVRFGTERNDDLPPDEWPNWCLEFMHNQLYEYFQGMGARWMKRPFSITLAKKVRWKTVKHMNRYFAHAERVIDAWREKGSQYLDPQLAYIEGGATPEEVARPHGIYLLRNGVPTNYFAPNFDPPYTTKMTRSLLLNVLGKSWDKKRREWTSEPVPRLISPSMLMTAMCGCGDTTAGGFMASEVTMVRRMDTSSIPDSSAIIRSDAPATNLVSTAATPSVSRRSAKTHHTTGTEDGADTDIISEPHTHREPFKHEPLTSPVQQGQLQSGPSQPTNEILSIDEHHPIDPADPSDEAQDENTPQIVTSTKSSTVSRSFKDLEEDMNLHMSSSTMSNTKSQLSSLSKSSAKYGRAPTPEVSTSPEHGEDVNVNGGSVVPSDENDPAALTTPASGQGDLSLGLVPNDPPMEAGAPSDLVQPSVTGTNSTIMHMNLSAEKFMKRDMERRQARVDEKKEEEVRQIPGQPVTTSTTLASDEDWLDAMGKPLPSPAMDPAMDMKNGKNSQTKEALEKERSRQIALIAMAQEQTSRAQDQPSGEKMDTAESVMRTKNGTSHSHSSRGKQPSVQRNDSGVSLEYSVDSTFIGDASTVGGSTLMGQNYAGEGNSVLSGSTKGSRQARQSRKSFASSVAADSEAAASSSSKKDDEDLSAFSLQESTSSMEAVPTDEELFGVGWAKALDPKSGSYYYFTLDRSKIVWDNPLATHQGSADSMDSPLPVGTAAI